MSFIWNEHMLTKFNKDESNPNNVPVDPHKKLQKGDDKTEKNVPHRKVVGS